MNTIRALLAMLDLAVGLIIGIAIILIFAAWWSKTPSSAYAPPIDISKPPILRLEDLTCVDTGLGDNGVILGTVTNVSHLSSPIELRSVIAVGTLYDFDEAILASKEVGAIKKETLEVGQSSPFRVFTKSYPNFKRCEVAFSDLTGKLIPHSTSDKARAEIEAMRQREKPAPKTTTKPKGKK